MTLHSGSERDIREYNIWLDFPLGKGDISNLMPFAAHLGPNDLQIMVVWINDNRIFLNKRKIREEMQIEA